MSFSSDTKTELCKVPLNKHCCAVAEAYGIILYANTFADSEIKIMSEHKIFAKRVPQLFQKAFGVDLIPVGGYKTGKNVFCLADSSSLKRVFAALGYDHRYHISYHLNRNIIEDDCCLAAFLRGIFLAAGTVAGPEKKSHLEIATSHQSLCREVMSLMLDMELSPKMTLRKASAVLYFKDTASVEDFITLIGAPLSAMAIMEAKVEKDLRNTVNRQVNCETANLIKQTDVSAKQVNAIQRMIQKHGEEAFPEKLRDTVKLRLENPSASLSELASMANPPLSKPGLNHRLRKIMEIAKKFEEELL